MKNTVFFIIEHDGREHNVTVTRNHTDPSKSAVNIRPKLGEMTLEKYRALLELIESAAIEPGPETEPENVPTVGNPTGLVLPQSQGLVAKPPFREFVNDIVKGGGGIGGMVQRMGAMIDGEKKNMTPEEKETAGKAMDVLKKLTGGQ